MGAAKKRREAFFAAHPMCCFCGGGELATTIDHVPLRAAFKGRVGPEGFEFPACEQCNSAWSNSEQVFALYARLFDQTDENYDQAHIQNLIAGVRNNQPDMIPNPNLSANEKRRTLRHFGWDRPKGEFLEDVGMVAIPTGSDLHVERVAAKMLAAFLYRHQTEFLTSDHGMFFGWTQQGLPGVDEAQDVLLSGMPELVIGARVNTSIGDQFAYRWGANPEEGLFGYAAGFGTGMFVFGASAQWSRVEKMENWQRFEAPK